MPNRPFGGGCWGQSYLMPSLAARMRGHFNRESVVRPLNLPGRTCPNAKEKSKSVERLEIKLSDDNLMSAKAEIPCSLLG